MKLELADLDFDSIKSNLKNFLKTQNEFQDYNFEGSALSVLLDVLSYNTHYMGFYGNMIANEMFLDSSTQRNSVISKAKELNYLPNQSEGSIATINVTINVTTEETTSINFPKGTRFTGKKKGDQGESFNFVLMDSLIIKKDENGLFTSDINVYQGEQKSIGWTYDQSNKQQKFIISDPTIDISNMTLTVGSSEPWDRFDNIVELTSLSEVYFLQEIENYQMEVYFGKGIVGKDPINEDSIVVEYLSTTGETGNECYYFEIVDDVYDNNGYKFSSSDMVVMTLTPSYDGKNRESIDSVKLVAPKNYEMQSRAVTKQDYFSVLMNKFNNIESINVWGGEDNDPPEYGKVFISIKPKNKLSLSPKQEEYIKEDILNKYNMIAVVPEILSPSYTFVIIDTTVNYNPNKSKFGANQIMSLIEDNVRDYFISELNRFDSFLKYSKILSIIDSADSSISNNLTELVIYKELIIDSGQQGIYTMDFDNAITKTNFSSEIYTDIDGNKFRITDDGAGNLVIRDELDNIVEEKKGSIDYENGVISIQRFTPKISDGSTLRLYADTAIDDVYTKKNNLIILDDLNITLNQMQ